MSNYKTVPNQKEIKVIKQKTDSKNYFTMINLDALENAGIDLQAGAFKLWIYFAKNKNNYEFALSSKAVEEDFGIKIKQYNNAIQELISKGYLQQTTGNKYLFYEKPVITKEDNEVIPKGNNELIPKETRNIIYNTNTKQNEFIF